MNPSRHSLIGTRNLRHRKEHRLQFLKHLEQEVRGWDGACLMSKC